MSSRIDAYLQRIVNQTDCTKAERKDMYEEMHGHLTILRQDYMNRGYSEKEAEDFAMRAFGNEAAIGDELQQALFPYRRELLLILALGSYLFVCVHYFFIMFTESVADNWLFVPAISQATLLFFALNQTYAVNRKLWLNLALTLHLLLMGVFAYPSSQLENPIWQIIFLSFIVLTIFLIYRITLTYSSGRKNVFSRRLIHSVNITMGLIVAGFTYFYLFIFLWGGLSWFLLNAAIPFITWIVVYMIQIKLLNNHSKWITKSLFLWFIVLFFTVGPFVVFNVAEFSNSDVPNMLLRILWPIQPFN